MFEKNGTKSGRDKWKHIMRVLHYTWSDIISLEISFQ